MSEELWSFLSENQILIYNISQQKLIKTHKHPEVTACALFDGTLCYGDQRGKIYIHRKGVTSKL